MRPSRITVDASRIPRVEFSVIELDRAACRRLAALDAAEHLTASVAQISNAHGLISSAYRR